MKDKLRITYQGQEVELSEHEITSFLMDSTLPWFMDETSIYVIGWNTDIEILWGESK